MDWLFYYLCDLGALQSPKLPPRNSSPGSCTPPWVGLEGTKQFHVQVFLLFRCTSSVALGLGQPGGWIFPLEVIFKEIFTIGSFCFDHWHQRHPHPFRPCAVLVLPQHFHLLSRSPAFPRISQSFCPRSAPPDPSLLWAPPGSRRPTLPRRGRWQRPPRTSGGCSGKTTPPSS